MSTRGFVITWLITSPAPIDETGCTSLASPIMTLASLSFMPSGTVSLESEFSNNTVRRKDATCMDEGSALRILIRLNRAASSFF